MKTFKFFWTTHKWTGIILAVIFAMTSVTGFMLLIKKKVDWIQPPTQKGAPGELAELLTIEEVFAVVFAQEHPAFASLDDIDRIDFRPGKRVHKVRSNHDQWEIQVDAVSGEVLSVKRRMSDLLENLHDGSFFGDWVHAWVMPVVTCGLLLLVFSGLWLWIEPSVRKRRRKRRQARRRSRPGLNIDVGGG
jgi:uncharacterized iron-regulated membrane protein